MTRIIDPLRYPCSHLRTPENTIRRKAGRECRTCNNVRQGYYREQRKRSPRPTSPQAPRALRWISAPREVIESCRPAFDAAMAVKKAAGRPRKSPQTTTHSEAAA